MIPRRPTHLTANDRLDEIASILAAGILRLRLKRVEKQGETENFPLDNRNQMAPYGTPNHIDNKREKP